MNKIDINPVPIIHALYFFIKSGTGILKLYLLKNLVIEYTGHMPHPKRAAKRNSTNSSGMPNCQRKIKVILFPPIEISDCIMNMQRSEMKIIKVVALNTEIILELLQNLFAPLWNAYR